MATAKKKTTATKKKTGATTKKAPAARKTAAKSAAPKKKAAKEEKAEPAKPEPVQEKATKAAEPTPAPVEETKTAESPEPAAAAASDSKIISMKSPIVVRDLATQLQMKPFQVVHELMEMNIFATLNQTIDEETASKICEKKGFTFELERREKGGGVHKEEKKPEIPAPAPVEKKNLKPRPPVITFMGHVDHGKTSLLDAIRQTKVAAGEAGGITQHIGAYSIERKGQTITFLDTPGHAAFTAMRARGANVTDIAVIVVAADDGLMPQTREAIQHAKAAGVTIMIAINKMDLAGANPDQVKSQLQEIELVPEDWGGDIVTCQVSATKGTGIDELLDLMLLQAEVLEVQADPAGIARGTVIESQIEPGRGPNATIIVTEGTLKVGDSFICGPHWGKVKALINDVGKTVKKAGPATPAKVLGFSGAPVPGEEFTVMPNEREARQVAEERQQDERLNKLSADRPVTLEGLFETIADGQKKTLNIVLKSDVQGSIEAIVDSLKKIPSDKVDVNFILAGVGPISVNDVLLAKASQAIIIGFNTKTENQASSAAKREEVQIRLYSIIYELIDQVKEAMAGMLDPELRETHLGQATVKKTFKLSKYPVAGCLVESGRISRKARARVLRDGQHIYDGSILTLKRFQDEVPEVRAGMECGIRLGDFKDYHEEDVIECYELEKVAQTL